MTDKPADARTQLRRIVEALVDLAFEGFVPDVGAVDEEPRQLAERLRSRMLASVREVQQGKLRQAKRDYVVGVAKFAHSRVELPGTPQSWRDRLTKFFSAPDVKALVTAQFRDLTKLSDEDVMNLALRLRELGYLQDDDVGR